VTDRVVHFAAGRPVHVAVAHADGLAAAWYLQERLSAALGGIDVPILEAGAVITTHVGLGAIAVAVQTGDLPLEKERSHLKGGDT